MTFPNLCAKVANIIVDRDPVYVGPGYVYRSRRGILTKPWNKLQIREIESLTL